MALALALTSGKDMVGVLNILLLFKSNLQGGDCVCRCLEFNVAGESVRVKQSVKFRV